MIIDRLVIRRASAADAAALAAFGTEAFRETFGADNTPDDMAAYLAATYDEDKQKAEIANADIVTLIAQQSQASPSVQPERDAPTIDSRMIAFAQVRRTVAPLCVTLPHPVEIWRFYVGREWHGMGVAQALMAAAFDAAGQLGGKSVWLSVWERNARGIRFYEKCGFRDVGTKVFLVGSDRQTDRVMAREIAQSPSI